MLHTKRETILKGRLGTNILEVGAYYAMLSDMNAHCLVHVLEQDKGDYIVDSLYVSKPKRMFRFWHNFTKVRKTTAEVFQQAVDCYDNSVNAILSIDFDKTPVESYRDTNGYYFRIQGKSNNRIFGRLITQFDLEEVEVNPEGKKIDTSEIFFEELSPKVQFYSIDPKIYQKVKKMYDILSHSLATLINSCLE